MNDAATGARRLSISGRVQGVGFRPFVYRLAHKLGVRGRVHNAAGEVLIFAEGSDKVLDFFEKQLISVAPPLALPRLKSTESVCTEGLSDFSICASHGDGHRDIHVPPDQFACDDCLAEMTSPGEHRYGYPFINCTQCGPRYTIINAMPYDRPNTSMAGFPMCRKCAAEYGNPLDRRFHAQPLACPDCGPALTYVRNNIQIVGTDAVLARCLEDLSGGEIIALRGIGGYHLICDAYNEAAVLRLRHRKHRPSKPFAIMVPWRGDDGLDGVRMIAEPTSQQSTALMDPSRPIVLVNTCKDSHLADSMAPGLNEVGIMLPYSPLHYLLLEAFGAPVIATSGNVSGEPVLTDPVDAEQRLVNVADSYVHHNRPIRRPADDPVIRQIAGRMRPIRLGRGNAPLELELPFSVERPLLAVGAYLKNTVALAFENRAIISPHIGDLSSRRSRCIFEQVVADLQILYAIKAEEVVFDAHQDYPNSRWARDCGLPSTRVYHHQAHASALAGELGIDRTMLIFTWDGLGLGEDNSLWGGEALMGRPGNWRRVASFRPFRLPGGDRCVNEPWRTALSFAWDSAIDWPDAPLFDPLLREAFDAGFNSPLSSSVGRMFDAAAVFSGLLSEASYDGEAPILLEAACADNYVEGIDLPLVRDDQEIWRADWYPLFQELASRQLAGPELARLFHESMVKTLVKQARLICHQYNIRDLGLTGGVFQNRRLADTAISKLLEEGFKVHLPEQLPVNDGGISFGQLVEASARRRI